MSAETGALVTVMLVVNAAIAIVCAWGMRDRSLRRGRRPSWTWTVGVWLAAKSFWLGTLAVCWGLGVVGFPPAHGWHLWAERFYVAVIAVYTLAHARAAYFWLTGRATVRVVDRNAGAERGTGFAERRAREGEG